MNSKIRNTIKLENISLTVLLACKLKPIRGIPDAWMVTYDEYMAYAHARPAPPEDAPYYIVAEFSVNFENMRGNNMKDFETIINLIQWVKNPRNEDDILHAELSDGVESLAQLRQGAYHGITENGSV